MNGIIFHRRKHGKNREDRIHNIQNNFILGGETNETEQNREGNQENDRKPRSF